MNKVALVAATIIVSVWVIMWLELPPVFNAPLPADQQVVAVVNHQPEKVILTGQVIQSVPDPDLATSKDITSTRLKAAASSVSDVKIEVPGWLRVSKKSGIDRTIPSNVKFFKAADLAKFPKLVEIIEIADLKNSYQFPQIASTPLTEFIQVPSPQVHEIVEFMEGRNAVVENGKEYNWAIMLGMNIYSVQLKISELPK